MISALYTQYTSDFSVWLNTVDLLIDLAIVLTGMMKLRLQWGCMVSCSVFDLNLSVLCVFFQTVGWMFISSALRWCLTTANRTWSTWRRCTAVTSPHWSRLTTLSDPWWWTCAYERSKHEVTEPLTMIYTKQWCRDILYSVLSVQRNNVMVNGWYYKCFMLCKLYFILLLFCFVLHDHWYIVLLS